MATSLGDSRTFLPSKEKKFLTAKQELVLRNGVFALAILAVLVSGLRFFYATNEDAWIDFKYMRNLADGYGLVSNPGGEHEEGYSNLLWVLIMAAGRWLANFDLLLMAKIIGILSLILLTLFSRSILRGTYIAAGFHSVVFDIVLPTLLMIAIGCSTYSSHWATQCLETTFYSLQLVLLVYFFWQLITSRKPLFIYILGLLCLTLWLTRPEGGMNFFVVFSLIISFAFIERQIRGQFIGPIVRSIAILVILIGGILFWKLKYFGDILANPSHIKLGLRHFAGFTPYALNYMRTKGAAFSILVAVALVVALLYAFSRLTQRKDAKVALLMLLLVGLIGSQIFFVWYVRNDYMNYWRFWITHYPLAVLLVFLATPLAFENFHWDHREFWVSALSVAAALVMVSSALWREPPPGGNWWETHFTHPAHALDDAHYGIAARQLSALMAADKNAKYALSEYGYIPYHAEGFGIDMMGINSRRLARNFRYYPFEEVFYAFRDAVLVQLPKVVIIGGVYRTAPSPAEVPAFPEPAYCDGSGCRTEDFFMIPGCAWFFKSYLESAFFRTNYILNAPTDQSKWEWTFFRLRTTPQISSSISADNPEYWDQLLRGFREENGMLWCSSICRAMIKTNSSDREVCFDGTNQSPASNIELRFDGEAVGDRIAAVHKANGAKFSVCAPIDTASKNKPILVTIRTDSNSSLQFERLFSN